MTGLGLAGLGAAALAGAWLGSRERGTQMLTVYTFGDSILDCGRYNEFGVHPGQLLARNDDRLFPEFRGRDLSTHAQVQLVHRARDGATIDGLAAQARDLAVAGRSLALLTIGGNDLLRGLAGDTGAGMRRFSTALDLFLQNLRIRPVLLGTVYDPTFGDDARNFLGIDPAIARANLHAHFLSGDPSWFTHTIEPSLQGASEVRRAFLQPALRSQGWR
jgi:acyl-CoA thioesterase I